MNNCTKEAAVEVEHTSINLQYIARVEETLILQLCTCACAETQCVVLCKSCYCKQAEYNSQNKFFHNIKFLMVNTQHKYK